jgi:hypothetical protein
VVHPHAFVNEKLVSHAIRTAVFFNKKNILRDEVMDNHGKGHRLLLTRTVETVGTLKIVAGLTKSRLLGTPCAFRLVFRKLDPPN